MSSPTGIVYWARVARPYEGRQDVVPYEFNFDSRKFVPRNLLVINPFESILLVIFAFAMFSLISSNFLSFLQSETSGYQANTTVHCVHFY